MPSISDLLQRALTLHQSDQPAEAEILYRQILQQAPEHPDALHMLGLIAYQAKSFPQALRWMSQSLTYNPNSAGWLSNIAILLAATGMFDPAIAILRRALAFDPDTPEAHNNLGNLLLVRGQREEAIACYQRALKLRPDYQQARMTLARAQQNLPLPAAPPPPTDPELLDAIADAERNLGLRLDAPEAYFNLGNVQIFLRQIDEAIASFQQAITLRPNYANAHNNLGNALKDCARLDEALEHFRLSADQAVPPKENPIVGHSNYVYTMLFHPDYSQQRIADALAEWNERFAVALTEAAPPPPRRNSAGRKLRIGYVSPDLRDHVVGRNVLPIVEQHNRNAVEVYFYSACPTPDDVTARFKKCAAGWRDIASLNSANAAQQIRDDGIDVLVDLSLHLANHRLLIFAHRPAPVQITWAGYPGSTGLTAIDYRISDPYLDPGMNESFYSEKTLHLPHSFWCFDPLGADVPVGDLPARRNGYITFGCLNNFCKINTTCLRLWAEAMQRVPNSRLVLLSEIPSAQQWVRQVLEDQGIAAERVQFVPPSPRIEYLKHYHGIDIGLDSLPYNGHSTSLDSFWMGVPVVTRVGQAAVSRAGYSQLMNLNLPHLAAKTPGEFAAIAAKLAGDLKGLSDLRASLRRRMDASPLMNPLRFARDLEALYQDCVEEKENE